MKTFEYLFKTIVEESGDTTITLEGWDLLTSNIASTKISNEDGALKVVTVYRCIFKREKKGNS